MKIRNHRNYEWLFHPTKNSKLKKHLYTFKYKRDLMKFLNNNIKETVNGEVSLEHKCFGSSGTKRMWFVWYNSHALKPTPLKVILKQLNFRDKKYIFKEHTISKKGKKYFAFSKKVLSLMSNIYQKDDKTILPKDAKKLINLFEKRGFKDFEPNEEDLEYINGHISDGIDFYYWSDRCNFLRCKVILEYFKQENLI